MPFAKSAKATPTYFCSLPGALGVTMHIQERFEFDETRMTSESRRFAKLFFNRFPELRRYAAIERLPESDQWTLVVNVPAPSGDPRAELAVWVEGGDDPSVAFGNWHTHENVWAPEDDTDSLKALLDLVSGILADRFVSCEDIGGEGAGTTTILDLFVEDAILQELTSKYSPGRAYLRSWSGRLDREVALDNI